MFQFTVGSTYVHITYICVYGDIAIGSKNILCFWPIVSPIGVRRYECLDIRYVLVHIRNRFLFADSLSVTVDYRAYAQRVLRADST